MTETFDTLAKEIRACRACQAGDLPFPHKPLPHEPRPVIMGSNQSLIRIIGQAPGTKVHESGVLFDDASGDRLRSWLNVTRAEFYNPDVFAITPMGFCFPGQDAKGSDLPPPKLCGALWQDRLDAAMTSTRLTLLVGQYAQKQHLGASSHKTLTETVRHWRDYGPDIIPLPHPSWRVQSWLKKNPWFGEVLETLQFRVRDLIER